MFRYLFAAIAALFITMNTSVASNKSDRLALAIRVIDTSDQPKRLSLAAYCREHGEQPVCGGRTSLNLEVTVRALQDESFLFALLAEDRTAEGETSLPITPVSIHSATGTYSDSCAIRSWNFQQGWNGLPHSWFSLAVIRDHDGNERSALLVRARTTTIIVDCAHDRMFTQASFEGEDGEIVVAQTERLSESSINKIVGIDFDDFTVPVAELGSVTPKLVRGTFSWTYRTRISEAAKVASADFGGSYLIAEWGCGTECQTGAIIRGRTGEAYPLPTSEWGIDYRPDSMLLIVNPLQNVEEMGYVPSWLTTKYYVWDHDHFRLLLEVKPKIGQ